jgi:hypothetical protein
MKIARLAGLIALAVAALSLAAASLASAALPSFNPSTKQKFIGTSGEVKFVAASGVEVITCTKATSQGEITEAMLVGNITDHFLECTSAAPTKQGCAENSVGASTGLILTKTIHGVLGLVLPSGLVGVTLLPVSGHVFVELERNECTKATSVTGSIAGLLSPVGKSQTTGTLTFHAVHPGSSKEEIEKVDTLSGLAEPELVGFTTVASGEGTESVTAEKAVEVT